jgi:hypothetical protein
LNVSKPKVSSPKASYTSAPSSGYVSYDSNGNGMSTNQAPTTANQLFNIPTNNLQNAISPSTAVYNNPTSNYVNTSSGTVKKSTPKSTGNGKSSSNNSSSNGSSNRSLAQSAFNGAMGINTANADTGVPTPITDGGFKGAVKSGVASLINFRNQANDFARSKGIDTPFNTDWGISELLGIPKGSIINEQQQVNPNYTSTINPFDVLDRTTSNDVSTLQDITNGTPVDFNNSPALSGGIDRSTTNTEQDRPTNYNRPTPHQVTNPFVTPNSVFTQPQQSQQSQQVQAPQYDFTPPQTQQGGTQRQFLGNGSIMSNGAYNNGQGNYGMEGASTGTSQQDPNSLLNDLISLLSVNKAQAAEPQNFGAQAFTQPQSNFNFNSSPFGQAVNTPNAAYAGSPYFDPSNYAKGTNNNPNPNIAPTGNPGGSKSGGVTQQYAQQGQQQAGNTTKLLQQTEKGYTAQEKAQKKATDELIKSIQNQYASQIDATNKTYDTQQTQGSSDLEKAKQADLLRLSGLFNFSANQSPDSEQRIQYQQRSTDEANNTLKDFLAKIMSARNTDIAGINTNQNKDISSAKQGLQTALASIADKRGASQLEIAKMQDAANAAKIKSGASSMGLNSNAVGSLQSYLSGVRGQDGYVNPQDYAQAQQAFAQDFPTKASSFSALFPVHQYLSPIEYKNIYGSSQPPINISFDNQQ